MSNTKQAVTYTQPRAQQGVAKAASAVDNIKGFLQSPEVLEQIKMACNKLMTPERAVRIAITSMLSSPKLQECGTTPAGKASIIRTLLTATQLGLELDGRQAHMVPFRCKQPDGSYAMVCQLIPGYQGLIDLAYNHPDVSGVWADVVYEKDHFVYAKGLDRKLEHIPYDGDDDPGPLKFAYAVCERKGGNKIWVVLNRRDIKKIRASSRSSGDAGSVWNTNESAMWMKSAIRALSKFMPRCNELRHAMDIDDEASTRETIEVTSANVPTAVGSGASMLLSNPEPAPTPQDPIVMQPSDDGDLGPSQAAPNTSASESLYQICKANKISFDQFIKAARLNSWIKDNQEFDGFDQLPNELCATLLKAPPQALVMAIKGS